VQCKFLRSGAVYFGPPCKIFDEKSRNPHIERAAISTFSALSVVYTFSSEDIQSGHCVDEAGDTCEAE